MDNDTHAITAGVSRAITAGLMAGGYQHASIRDALLAEFVVIPRADLPEVVKAEGGVMVDGAYFRDMDVTPAARRNQALRQLALAEFLEAREAAAADAKRDQRRDELARELGRLGEPYPVDSSMGRAIDRIIDLEAQVWA